MRSVGKVYLVGAGPGDPGLLTLKGRDLLARADVVLYDHLVNPEILRFAAPHAELVGVGPNHDPSRLTQDEIHHLLIERARAGNCVVRLKGGDPFMFGRGGEEAEALREAGVDWQVVPGVSAGLAAPACAGIPVTHREHASSVAFVTGHECGDKKTVDWKRLAHAVDTLVIFMGGKNLSRIVSELLRAGQPGSMPMAVIERGSQRDQRVRLATLDTILESVREQPLQSPALIVVGEVVRLRRKLASLVGSGVGEECDVLSCLS